MAVASIGLGYAGAYPLTITAAFLMSLLGTSATIRFWAALADQHCGGRTVAMTEGEVSVSTGGIIAPFAISGAAATMLGWPSAFLVGTAAAAATVLASLIIPIPAGTTATPNQQPQGRPGKRRHRLPPTLIVIFAVVALEWSLSFWLASYLHDDVHTSSGLAASIVSVLYAANLAGRLVASRLARHMTAGRLLALCLAVACCGLPPLLAASGPIAAAAAVAVTGLGIGATFPLTSSLHVAANSGTSTSAIGQVMATASLGQLAGPWQSALSPMPPACAPGSSPFPCSHCLPPPHSPATFVPTRSGEVAASTSGRTVISGEGLAAAEVGRPLAPADQLRRDRAPRRTDRQRLCDGGDWQQVAVTDRLSRFRLPERAPGRVPGARALASHNGRIGTCTRIRPLPVRDHGAAQRKGGSSRPHWVSRGPGGPWCSSGGCGRPPGRACPHWARSHQLSCWRRWLPLTLPRWPSRVDRSAGRTARAGPRSPAGRGR